MSVLLFRPSSGLLPVAGSVPASAPPPPPLPPAFLGAPADGAAVNAGATAAVPGGLPTIAGVGIVPLGLMALGAYGLYKASTGLIIVGAAGVALALWGSAFDLSPGG
jgi:hypothetical protein